MDSRSKGPSRSGSSNTKCRNCGGSYSHEGGKTRCPAYQKECNNCGKLGHFKSVCRSEPKPKRSGQQRGNLRALEEDLSDSDDENAFRISIHSVHGNKAKHQLFKVKIGETWLTIMADSGSSINILDENDYKKLQSPPKLEDTSTRVYPYKSNKPLKMLGKFVTTITTTDGATFKELVCVQKGAGGSLLSWQVSQNLKIISTVNPMATEPRPGNQQLVEEYEDLFTNLGKLKDYQVHLHINKDIQPSAQPHRRVSFHVRKQLEEQLEIDEHNGVIERVEGPSWGLELGPKSRYITTFNTHVGLRRFKRLNFGVSSAAEIFQNAIRETLSGIEEAINLSDDILVYGGTQEDHDQALRKTFQRLREKGLTLHRSKCTFSKNSLEFFDYVFSDKGISAEPKKVEAIVNLQSPSNVTEVRSLLGMSNYCSRFISGYATLTQLLRELTQKKCTMGMDRPP